MAVRAPTHFPAFAAAGLLAPDRSLLALALLFGAVAALLWLAVPLLAFAILDPAVSAAAAGRVAGLAALAAALLAGAALLDHARARLLARIGARIETRLHATAVAADLSAGTGTGTGTGTGAGTATAALADLRRALADPVAGAVLDLAGLPVVLAVLVVWHPALGALALVAVLALGVVLAAALPRAAGAAAASRAEAGAAAAILAEARGAADLLAAQGMAGALADRWRGAARGATARALQAADRGGAIVAAARGARSILAVAVLGLAAPLVLRGDLGPGAVVAALLVVDRVLAPLQLLLTRWPMLAAADAAGRRLAAAAAAPAALLPPLVPPLPLPRPAGRLELRRVTLAGPDPARPLLADLSLRIAPGEALGVIGPTGAGKSVLARVAAGVLAPDAGVVQLGRARLGDYPAAARGAHVGYLPQEVALFTGTLADNIARMQRAAPRAAVEAAARAAGLHETILALPGGYDTPVGPATPVLSGGQRQRLGLARAVFGMPVLLVLDEPTAALDAAGAAALADIVAAQKARGGAVLIVAHRAGAVAGCDRVLAIEAGRLRALDPGSADPRPPRPGPDPRRQDVERQE